MLGAEEAGRGRRALRESGRAAWRLRIGGPSGVLLKVLEARREDARRGPAIQLSPLGSLYFCDSIEFAMCADRGRYLQLKLRKRWYANTPCNVYYKIPLSVHGAKGGQNQRRALGWMGALGGDFAGAGGDAGRAPAAVPEGAGAVGPDERRVPARRRLRLPSTPLHICCKEGRGFDEPAASSSCPSGRRRGG